jgi:hypothetical protein
MQARAFHRNGSRYGYEEVFDSLEREIQGMKELHRMYHQGLITELEFLEKLMEYMRLTERDFEIMAKDLLHS